LKLLWVDGVEVFDVVASETFMMHAMLFCTINDFPAYGNLSGYSVKGHKACPICEENTASHQLKKSIFFDLPYWSKLEVRHCIDVMLVEKNVCDSLIGTLLNI